LHIPKEAVYKKKPEPAVAESPRRGEKGFMRKNRMDYRRERANLQKFLITTNDEGS